MISVWFDEMQICFDTTAPEPNCSDMGLMVTSASLHNQEAGLVEGIQH